MIILENVEELTFSKDDDNQIIFTPDYDYGFVLEVSGNVIYLYQIIKHTGDKKLEAILLHYSLTDIKYKEEPEEKEESEVSNVDRI